MRGRVPIFAACYALVGCASTQPPGPVAGPAVDARPVASLTGTPGSADGAAFVLDRPLTLQEAIRLALVRNHALMLAREGRRIADGQITEARAAAMPTIGVQASYMRLDRASTFPGSPSYDLPVLDGVNAPTGDHVTMLGTSGMQLGSEDNYAAALTLQQPLYLGGRATAARRIAAANRRSVEHQIAAAEQGIAFLVHKGFYDVLLAREDVDAAQEAQELARRHVEDVTRRLEQGMATRFEVTRAEARLEMAEVGAIGARSALTLARTSLFTQLRMPPDSDVDIDGALVFAALGKTAGDEVQAALAHRPELAQHDVLIAMQLESLGIVRADHRPAVLITGEAGWQDPSQMSFGELEADTYWRAGIVMNMTLFDGLRARGKMQQERARLAQVKLARDQLADQIRLEVTQARLTVADAEEMVGSQAKVLETAREALRLAQAGYEQGVSRQLDVLDAQLGLTDARHGYSRAVYGHLLARAALEKATGSFRFDAEKGGAR